MNQISSELGYLIFIIYFFLLLSPNQISSFKLQGHTKHVHSVCWDPSGEYVVSVSENSVRVWSLSSGNDGECVHELSCSGNKFYSCVFHPTYPHLLVIGCYQVSRISLRSYFVSYCLTDILPCHHRSDFFWVITRRRYLHLRIVAIKICMDKIIRKQVEVLIAIRMFFLQSLELWDMSENETMTLPAHEGLIAALAVSNANGLVASVSHDKFIKLWK